jgi:hypothetical protein
VSGLRISFRFHLAKTPPNHLNIKTWYLGPYLLKFLCRDTVATWCAAEWPLTATLFNGDTASGPVPRLFAANPPEALAALVTDDARFVSEVFPNKNHFIASKSVG